MMADTKSISLSSSTSSAISLSRHSPRAGFLHKLGSNIQLYKRRFFVLQQPSTFLYYYLNEHDTQPKGCLDVTNCRIEFLSTPPTPSTSVSSPPEDRHRSYPTQVHTVESDDDDQDDDDVFLNKIQVSCEHTDPTHPSEQQQQQRQSQNRNDEDSHDSSLTMQQSSSCRFAIIWDQTGERIQLQAPTEQVANDWVRSIKAVQVSCLQRDLAQATNENAILQQRVKELELECRSLQHIENDRDGALDDALQWKQQFEMLDTELLQLAKYIQTKATAISQQNEGSKDDRTLLPSYQHEEEKKTDGLGDAIITLSTIDNHGTDDDNPLNKSLLDQGTLVDNVSDENNSVFFGEGGSKQFPHDDNDNSMEVVNTNINNGNGNGNDNDNDNIVASIPGTHYSSLYDAVVHVLEQYHITRTNTTTALQNVASKQEQLTTIQSKMSKAEKHLCEIWEENCSIRKVLKQTKRDKRVLVREVRNLLSSIQKQQQHQNRSTDQDQQHPQAPVSIKDQRLQYKDTTSVTSTDVSVDTNRDNDDIDDEHGQRLIDELEKHVLSSIRLNQEFLLAANTSKNSNSNGITSVNSGGILGKNQSINNRRHRTLSPPQRRRLAVATAAKNNTRTKSNEINSNDKQQVQSDSADLITACTSSNSRQCQNNTELLQPIVRHHSSYHQNHDEQIVSELDTSIETSFDHDDESSPWLLRPNGTAAATTTTVFSNVPIVSGSCLSHGGNIRATGLGGTGTGGHAASSTRSSVVQEARTRTTSVASLVDNGSSDDDGEGDFGQTDVQRTDTTTSAASFVKQNNQGKDLGQYNATDDSRCNEDVHSNTNNHANYEQDYHDHDEYDTGEVNVHLEGNVILLNGEEIRLNDSKDDRFIQQRPNPLLQLDSHDDDHCHMNKSDQRKNGDTSTVALTRSKNTSMPTTKLSCPLADVVSTSENSERTDEELQPYHLTFYGKRIGIQFMKVPFQTAARTKGLLTDAMKSDLTTNFNSFTSVHKQSSLGTSNNGNRKGNHDDITCQVATPVDAVLVCGFHGFDDNMAGNVRPKLGAKLIAFDGVSVEVGKWTFNSIKKAIQSCDRPLTLSFRNDFLTTEQRTLLTKAISTSPTQIISILPVQQQKVTDSTSSLSTPEGGGGGVLSDESESFASAIRRNKLIATDDGQHTITESEIDDYSIHGNGSGSEYSGSRYSSYLPSSFSGRKRIFHSPEDIKKNNNYYSSFSDAGTMSTTTSTTSVLSSVVPTLVSNLLNRSQLQQSRGRGVRRNNKNSNGPFTPEYLCRAQTSVEGTPQHQDFQSELL